MYVCILNQKGEKLLHQKVRSEPAAFLRLIKPYRRGVVAVECMFCWYWVSDLCADHGIPFALGHAYYMKVIHGGKSKHDKIDSYKIAALLRGGNLPMSYVYPSEMRATRDVLRRRMRFVRRRGGIMAHIQNTVTQYSLPPLEKRLDHPKNRSGLLEHFEDEDLQMSIAVDMQQLDSSPSGREWGWVHGQLEAGISEERIYLRLLERVCARRGADAPRYARRTLTRALRRVGSRAAYQLTPTTKPEEARLTKA